MNQHDKSKQHKTKQQKHHKAHRNHNQKNINETTTKSNTHADKHITNTAGTHNTIKTHNTYTDTIQKQNKTHIQINTHK